MSSALPSLLIRADASRSIGAGHVMRCVAIGQEWSSRGGRVVFAATEITPGAEARVQDSGFELHVVPDAPGATVSLAREVGTAWVVIDVGARADELLGAFDSPAISAQGKPEPFVLAIDDLGGHFATAPALVLNQNAHGTTTEYPGLADDTLLRGLSYLLLRDEFVHVAPSPHEVSTDPRILLAFGGTDPLDLLAPVAQAIVDQNIGQVVAVCGSTASSVARLRELANAGVIELHVDTTDMAGLMQTIDLAVTSGGTTVWELAYMGIPSLVGTVSPLEERLVTGLQSLDLFHTLGDLSALSPDDLATDVGRFGADHEWRQRMHHRATEVVDGQGRKRVVDTMIALSGGTT